MAQTKKNSTPLDLGRFKGTSLYDGEPLKKLYDQWVKDTDSLKGVDIGFNRYTGSLLDFIRDHGVSGRVMGNSGPSSVSEERKLGKVIDAVKALANNKAFDVDGIREIISVYNVLTRLNRDNESDDNPRNIVFQDPVDFDDETFKVLETKPVYGHYITANYIAHRSAKASRNKKISVPDRVDKKYYSYTKGDAEPPYWEYTLGPQNSLRVVLREGLKTLKDAKHQITTPILIEKKRGAGEYSYLNFKEVNGFFKKIFAKNNIKNYITPKGNISTDKIARALSKIKIYTENNTENEKVKEWMGAVGLPGTIQTFYIRISRRQINNIAKKYFEKNFEAALKAREKKDDSNVSKSWRELLAW